MQRLTWGIVFILFSILLVGCGENEEADELEANNEKLKVFTTVYPLQFIVESLGGEMVEVQSVYPPGADGHIYEPSSKDMTEFAKADALFYIGAGMEGFTDSLSNALASQEVALIEMGQYKELFQKGMHRAVEVSDEEIMIEIDGVQDHYHTGDEIFLQAKILSDLDGDHWHWFRLLPNESDWEIISEFHEDTYQGEARIAGEQIKAVLYNHDHEIIAESLSVVITIDDHEHDDAHHHGEDEHHANNHDDEHEHHPLAENVTIAGLAAHYHTGDKIELTASYPNVSDDDHWHWHTLVPGEAEWQVVEGMYGNYFKSKATTPGIQVKAVVYNDAHEAIAESPIQTILIDDHTDHDPHVWMDPLRMIHMAEMIRDELIGLHPEAEEIYRENFTKLEADLIALDQRFIDVLAGKENKHIIVPHSAFGYWEERYGIKQITISGLSSSEEPSQKQLVEVMEAAEAFDLQHVLYEQNSTNLLAQVIQEELGAEAVMIHNLEVRTEADIASDEDYISLMEYNLNVLDKILQ